MEKVFWITSYEGSLLGKTDDGLKIVNDYLTKGWTVKHISACATKESSSNHGQAYIVIEKKEKKE